MVMKLHQFVSHQAPPEIHGTLAEVGMMLDMDTICSDHDNGDIFPQLTAEDIEVPPDEEQGGN
eukprot:264275-Chlamydomonas_euryale.AAC.1